MSTQRPSILLPIFLPPQLPRQKYRLSLDGPYEVLHEKLTHTFRPPNFKGSKFPKVVFDFRRQSLSSLWALWFCNEWIYYLKSKTYVWSAMAYPIFSKFVRPRSLPPIPRAGPNKIPLLEKTGQKFVKSSIPSLGCRIIAEIWYVGTISIRGSGGMVKIHFRWNPKWRKASKLELAQKVH